MKRLLVIIFSVGLLAAGIAMELRALSKPEPPSVEPDPRLITPLDNAAGSPAGANPRFVLDVSDMLTKLNTLRPDEHPDQIADWAVYGTLVQAGLPSDIVRQATYNMVPLRLPSLEEVFDFDYGPGRRVFLPDGSVWLFYSARDNLATATLARLVDQVRMESGVLPASLSVFRYRSELVEGAIYIDREADIPGQALFSPEYGYIEQRISTAEDLIAWLNRIDDVTHIKKLEGGLELGGRRFAGGQTATINAEDVAALYQAHRRLADASRDVERQVQASSKPLVEAFDALVDLYNQNVHNYNQNKSVSFDGRRFAQAVAAVEKYLGNARSADSLQSKDISIQHRLVEALEPRVQRRVEELERDRYRELVHAGKLPADEPGFSLDPQWDVPSLLRDLTQLLKNPIAIIRPALKVAGQANGQEVDKSAPRRILITASGVANAFGESDPDAYRVQDPWRQRIATIVSSIRGKSGRQAEEGAIVPFRKLKEELTKEGDKGARQLAVILDHLESLHRAQCARYDGPLQGTRVGMNLFYTDILAKLWAFLDYYEAAPINEVSGFQSNPIEGPYLEPLYWTEHWAFPATRLWFGPKGESYKGNPETASGLNFTHISTRVYSAGSNPLKPGEETVTAELSRRIFGWWDRHFAKVADYEQAYHVQNQIMKWSVITGWMAENDILPDLDKIPVNRSHRFDRWYAASEDLRFRRAIAFLPEDRWLGGTECVEILRSYFYPSGGYRTTFTEGGVSLGSSKSLQTASHITQEIPPHLRRGGLDYSVSKSGKLSELKLVNLKKTTFEFPPAQADRAAVKASIPERARLRAGPTDVAVNKLTTEVVTQSGGGRITLASERGVVGEIRLERIRDRVRLLWRDGDLEADRTVLEDVGILLHRGESAAPELATSEQFLPHRGGYVIEREGQGVEVIRMQAAGAGKVSSPPPLNGGSGHPPPPDGSGPPRMFRAVADDPGTGERDVYLRTSALPRWWMIVASSDDAPKLNVEAIALDATKALEHLNGTRWQRLRPLSGDAGESPALVERVFTNRGPPETARPIRIKTHHSELSELHGYVEDGTLFLERPQDGALHLRFNELVVNEGISSNYVAEVVSAAGQSAKDAVYTAQPAFSADALRGLRAASYTAEGNYAAALAELHTASNGGSLRSAVESYTRQLPTDLLAQLREGAHSPAAAQFAHGNLPGQNADAQLIVALSALRRHRPQEAGNILRTALDEVPPSAAFAKAADGVFGSASVEAAHDYILAHHVAHHGSINGLSPEVAPHIGLQPAGFRLHTVLPKRELKGGKMLSRTEQVDLAMIFRDQPPSAIYVEDSKLLNKLDWDGAPGPSLSKIMKDPDVAWERLDTDAMGGFRPSFLLDGDTQFVRRDPTSVAQRPVRVNSVRPHAYLVRSCDADGNGMVSDQERARCVNE